MGFADLSITEIATEYNLTAAEVLGICDQLEIAYKSPQTRLALEDAKAVIVHILAQPPHSPSNSAKNQV